MFLSVAALTGVYAVGGVGEEVTWGLNAHLQEEKHQNSNGVQSEKRCDTV